MIVMIIRDLLLFWVALSGFLGVWQFFYLYLILRAYRLFCLENESFYKFCCRELCWKWRRRWNLSWYYDTILFKLVSIGRGVLCLIVSLGLGLLLYWLSISDWSFYLSVNL